MYGGGLSLSISSLLKSDNCSLHKSTTPAPCHIHPKWWCDCVSVYVSVGRKGCTQPMMLVLYQINTVRIINQLCHHDDFHHDLSYVGHVRHLWAEARDSHGQSGILEMERTGWRFCDKRSKKCLEKEATESRRIRTGLDRNMNRDWDGKKSEEHNQEKRN